MSVRIVAQLAVRDSLRGEAHAGERAEIAAQLSRSGENLPGVIASHAGAHFDFSVGGGDLTWDLSFESQDALADFSSRVRSGNEHGPHEVMAALGVGDAKLGELADLGHQIESAEFAIPESLAEGISRPGLIGVKRTLWLRVLPEAKPNLVARFERDTPILAAAIPAIRNWRWSRIRTTHPYPMETRWTHLWEQEFESVDGLQIDYMSSPAHWGYIDGYFNPEMPEQVVDVWLAHLACPTRAPVLTATHTR